MQELPSRLLNRLMPIPESGCLVWMGHCNHEGYGQIYWNGTMDYVHRIVFESINGEIPPGAHLDHLCRVRCCANAHHLEAVTRKENILRGESPFAINARKSHCKRGHLFSDDNTYIKPDGCRECVFCRALRKKRFLEKRCMTMPEPERN